MWLVLLRIPPDPWPVLDVARSTGLAPADVRQRTAGGAPSVLRTGSAAELGPMVDALEKLGFAVLVCGPEAACTDDDRVVARTLELRPDGFVAIDGAGQSHPCPAGAIRLIQRGTRLDESSETVTTTEKKLSAARALLTGGLVMRKTVTREETKTTSSREGFVLVHRDDGQPDVILYERRIDYRFLGARMAHGSAANLTIVLERLRALAPSAPLDERVARPGLVQRMPRAGQVDPVDLALHLVALSHVKLARWNRP